MAATFQFVDSIAATPTVRLDLNSKISGLLVHPRLEQPLHQPRLGECATFHGDYIGVSYGSDGVANLAWTDMRDFVENGPFGTGFSQFIYFARH